MADKIINLSLEPWHVRAFRKYAYASKQEACGILVGHITKDGMACVEQIRPINNIADIPSAMFEFDPKEYLSAISDTNFYKEDAPLTLLGMWHTHPNYPGYPSTVDWRMALNGKVIEGLYFIYSTLDNELHSYIWDGQTFKVIRRFNEKA